MERGMETFTIRDPFAGHLDIRGSKCERKLKQSSFISQIESMTPKRSKSVFANAHASLNCHDRSVRTLLCHGAFG